MKSIWIKFQYEDENDPEPHWWIDRFDGQTDDEIQFKVEAIFEVFTTRSSLPLIATELTQTEVVAIHDEAVRLHMVATNAEQWTKADSIIEMTHDCLQAVGKMYFNSGYIYAVYDMTSVPNYVVLLPRTELYCRYEELKSNPGESWNEFTSLMKLIGGTL